MHGLTPNVTDCLLAEDLDGLPVRTLAEGAEVRVHRNLNARGQVLYSVLCVQRQGQAR